MPGIGYDCGSATPAQAPEWTDGHTDHYRLRHGSYGLSTVDLISFLSTSHAHEMNTEDLGLQVNIRILVVPMYSRVMRDSHIVLASYWKITAQAILSKWRSVREWTALHQPSTDLFLPLKPVAGRHLPTQSQSLQPYDCVLVTWVVSSLCHNPSLLQILNHGLVPGPSCEYSCGP